MLTILYRIQIFLAVLISAVCFLAIWEHPLIGDDKHFLWHLEEAGSLLSFIEDRYKLWTGNVFHSLIWGVFLENTKTILVFKLICFPLFIVLAYFAYYISSGCSASFKQGKLSDFLTFAGLVWLAIPVAGETVVWLTGSVYLWTTTLGLGFLAYIYKKKNNLIQKLPLRFNILLSLPLFLFSFLLGTSSIQMFVAVLLVLIWWVLELKEAKVLKEVPWSFILGISGLFIGVVVLTLSPGNYIRLAETPRIDFLSSLAQFTAYIGGAYFGGGSGNLGSSLWMGVLILILGGSSQLSLRKLSTSMIWVLASVGTLLPMILVTYFTSPRTTFMAAIFLLMAAKFIGTPRNNNGMNKTVREIVPIIISLLVIVDGFTGWIANKSYSNEIETRMEIIFSAKEAGEREVTVPHLKTIPSRLTFMLNPDQDKAYLEYMAKHYGFNSITHNKATNPRTQNPLKTLKNNL
tara:strand:+ start:2425 stop:3807 length:1383 start_codon:yes stop_codon:yes gene_type:complete